MDPLVVAGLLWEGGLEDQFVRLVVQVVVQVVPQQAVDQHRLALKVVSQGCSPQASVKSGSARCHQLLLAELLAGHLVRPHVVEEALRRDEVQGPPVLVLKLGHNLRGALQCFLALAPIDQVDEDEEVHVEVNLEEDDPVSQVDKDNIGLVLLADISFLRMKTRMSLRLHFPTTVTMNSPMLD